MPNYSIGRQMREKREKQARESHGVYDFEKPSEGTIGTLGARRLAYKRFKRFLKEHPDLDQNRTFDNPSFAAPSTSVLKQYAVWLSTIIQPMLPSKPGQKEAPVCRSVKQGLSNLFTEIYNKHGLAYSDPDKHNVLDFIQFEMVRQGDVTTNRRETFNFGQPHVSEVNKSVWTKVDPWANSRSAKSRQPRSGRQLLLGTTLSIFFSTFGSRISAIVPKGSSQDVMVRELITGLRYQDIEVLLVRDEAGSTVHIVTFAQRWIKNNWDCSKLNGGILTWSSFLDQLSQDCTPFILTFGLADQAFNKIPSEDNTLQEMTAERLLNCEVPENLEMLKIPWKDEMKSVHIFRLDPSDRTPLSQSTWTKLFKGMYQQAGYSGSVTVHRLRQAVVNSAHKAGLTSVQHEHAFGQTTRTFKASYLNSHSGIDLQAISLGIPQRFDLVNILSGPASRRCQGQPVKLSESEENEALQSDVEYRNLQEELQDDDISHAHRKQLLSKLATRRGRVFNAALNAQQQSYREKQVTAAISGLPHDKASPTFDEQRQQRLMLFMPERSRLAEVMSAQNKCISKQERLKVISDLVVLAQQTQPVAYRPGEQPINNCCPVSFCGAELRSDSLPSQWTHIHHCRELEYNTRTGMQGHYCLYCLSWIAADDIDRHMWEIHINSASSLDCGPFLLTKSILVKPGSCPICLGDVQLPPIKRCQYFKTRDALVQHLSEHLRHLTQSITYCPHPQCGEEIEGLEDLILHFENGHGIDELGFLLDKLQKHNMRRSPVGKTSQLSGAGPTTLDDAHAISDSIVQSHKTDDADIMWHKKGYPIIDWNSLEARLEDLVGMIQNCIECREVWHYRNRLKDLNAREIRLLACEQRYGGYYGPRGEDFILTWITTKFTNALKAVQASDNVVRKCTILTYNQVVLAPYVVLHLIMEDMGCTEKEALVHQAAGWELGVYFFDDEHLWS